MYAFFKGTVDYLTDSSVELDVNGVGYEIQISPATAERLAGLSGAVVTIYTYTLVREDDLALFGFLSRDELSLFRKLITVSGVGPKAGLALLSVLSADDLRFAILSGDVKSISRAPGVGRKTAERLILELKDKIDAPLPGGSEGDVLSSAGIAGTTPEVSGDMEDAVSALEALGYARTDALRAVRGAAEAGVTGTEALLKESLKYMR